MYRFFSKVVGTGRASPVEKRHMTLARNISNKRQKLDVVDCLSDLNYHGIVNCETVFELVVNVEKQLHQNVRKATTPRGGIETEARRHNRILELAPS